MTEIEQALSHTYFGRGNFSVTYPDSGLSYCIVAFLPSPDYQCRLREAGSSGFAVSATPGRVRATDDEPLGQDSFAEYLMDWAMRVKEDLLHPLPVDEEIKVFAAKLEEELKSRSEGENLKAPFTDAEVAEMTAKLEAMSARLESLQERLGITEKSLKSLQDILKGARTDLDTYPRGVWLRVTAMRLWQGAKAVLASPEARQIVANEVKKYLGLHDGGPPGPQ
jgi:hypothetical protein